MTMSRAVADSEVINAGADDPARCNGHLSAVFAGRELIAGASCPFCGGVGVAAGTRAGLMLRRCDCSGPVLLSFPWTHESEYECWYREPRSYHEGEQAANGQHPSTERDLEHLTESVCRLRAALDLFKGRLLDIGAGAGTFVAAAAAHGFEAEGIEPNAQVVEVGRSLGRRLRAGGWREASGEFEVVTLHDVFEHLTRPWQCLDHVATLLGPGGLLVIETPEFGCPASRREGVQWKHVRPKQHICLYSELALGRMLTTSGWEVEAVVRPRRGALGKMTVYASRSRNS